MKNGKYETFKDIQEYLDDLYSSLSDYSAEELRHILLYQPAMNMQSIYNTLETIMPIVSGEHRNFIQTHLINLAIEIKYHKKYIEKEIIKK